MRINTQPGQERDRRVGTIAELVGSHRTFSRSVMISQDYAENILLRTVRPNPGFVPQVSGFDIDS